MLDKKTANNILITMEKMRQRNEHTERHTDHTIRICQAIVAEEAGYKSRSEWEDIICQIINSDVEFKKKLKKLNLERERRKRLEAIA